MWLPMLAVGPDGAETQDRDERGRPKWICHAKTCRINCDHPTAMCRCDGNGAAHCKHFGDLLFKFGCCGGPMTRIHACREFGACTVVEHDDGLEWKEKPVAVCLGCDKREPAT